MTTTSYDDDQGIQVEQERIEWCVDVTRSKKQFRNKAKRTIESGKRKWFFKKARAIDRLQDEGFARKTILEAHENPYGIVSLTLHYGTEKAKQMKLAFERTRIRSGGIRPRPLTRTGHPSQRVTRHRRWRFIR